MSLLQIILIMIILVVITVYVFLGHAKRSSSLKLMLLGIELTLVGIFITLLGLRSVELIIPYAIIAIGIVFCLIGFIKKD
jgi:FtsH-binding integral membrane protein